MNVVNIKYVQAEQQRAMGTTVKLVYTFAGQTSRTAAIYLDVARAFLRAHYRACFARAVGGQVRFRCNKKIQEKKNNNWELEARNKSPGAALVNIKERTRPGDDVESTTRSFSAADACAGQRAPKRRPFFIVMIMMSRRGEESALMRCGPASCETRHTYIRAVDAFDFGSGPPCFPIFLIRFRDALCGFGMLPWLGREITPAGTRRALVITAR